MVIKGNPYILLFASVLFLSLLLSLCHFKGTLCREEREMDGFRAHLKLEPCFNFQCRGSLFVLARLFPTTKITDENFLK